MTTTEYVLDRLAQGVAIAWRPRVPATVPNVRDLWMGQRCPCLKEQWAIHCELFELMKQGRVVERTEKTKDGPVTTYFLKEAKDGECHGLRCPR